MANFVFLTFYDKVCLGPRILSATVKKAGHKSSLIVLKEDSVRKITKNKNKKTNLNYQAYYKGLLRGCMYDINPWTEKELELLYSQLKEMSPDIVCISTRSFWVNLGRPIVRSLKKMLPHVTIVAGGWGPSLEPEKFLDYCDYVCFGEGENTILDIGKALDKGQKLSNIKNIIYLEGTELKRNPVYNPIKNLDEVAFPDFDPRDVLLIENNQILSGKDFHSKTIYDVFAGRGCPMNCTYCMSGRWNSLYKNTYGVRFPKVRLRSPKRCIEELEIAKSKGVLYARIKDEVFPFNKKWVDEFVFLYKEKINLPFFAYLRPEFHPPEMINKLHEAGLAESGLGIQSGSNQIRRDIYCRKCPNEKMANFAKFLERKKVAFNYDIICHNPFEKTDDLKATFHFLCSLPFANIQVFKLKYFPGAPISRMLKEKKPKAEKETTYRWYSILYCMATENTFMRKLAKFIEKYNLLKKTPCILQLLFIPSLLKVWFSKKQTIEKYKASFVIQPPIKRNEKT